ncbi:MAG: hypothetical protein AYK18_02335 [Theionarchaea archaeon DG-70]|nr:MAG: hypothetical protein AYK18_02335 [Theionarchaea archaeon DG-70]
MQRFCIERYGEFLYALTFTRKEKGGEKMFAKLISGGINNIAASIHCTYGNAPRGKCAVGMFPRSGVCIAGALGIDI